MNTQQNTTASNSVNCRKSALFAYEDANGETAFYTHAELLALRNAYVKAFPDQKDDVYEDDSIFDPNQESSLRQEMADWSNS